MIPENDMTQQTSISTGTALVIGRWQIFHKGHQTLLNSALNTASNVIVVLGSAYRSRNPQNPFTWQERRQMILSTLSQPDQKRVRFLPVRDYYDDARWNTAVREGVNELSQAAASRDVTLVGFKKDHSSYYLDNFHGWTWKGVERAFDINATELRNIFFETTDPGIRLERIRPYVRTEVLEYLRAWTQSPEYANRVMEHMAVAKYRKRWDAPFYLTADAVVQANNQILLVRRGGEIGHGLWALPGGFVEPGERLYAAALRELREETEIKVADATMQAAFRSSAVFDHPARSPRGRIITHAHHFNLGQILLPEVKGSDDAMEAGWIPINDLPHMEEQLFDDHAAILDHFLG
jgi:bifunctional NMN adenylyltransferase/nudix hydrolase